MNINFILIFIMFSYYINKLLCWVLPVNCVFCGLRTLAEQPNICPDCASDLPWLENTCGRCGLPLPVVAGVETLCGQCLHAPPVYHLLQTLFSYQFPIDQLVLRLKFQQQFVYAHLLGELLAERVAQYYASNASQPAMILPMPLHARRLRERGFNQAVELARPVARRLGVPIGYGCAKRVKYTAAQMELPLKLRAQNVQQAFVAAPRLAGLHVAIIDDVITSGHTVHELALALRAVGVTRIDVWGIARTLR
jgi:ComF family protein